MEVSLADDSIPEPADGIYPFSIVASCQYALNGRTTFYITRCLLGILEGGFIPDIVLYLSYFYKSRELPIRLGFFWIALTVTNIVSSFLAFGLLHLKGHNGLAGWRWLFAIEGALTGSLGIVSWSAAYYSFAVMHVG